MAARGERPLRPILAALLCSVALVSGCGRSREDGSSSSPIRVAREPFRGGVNWAGRADAAGFAYLAERGGTWVAAIPFGYGQRVPDEPPPGGFRFSRYPGEGIEDTRSIVREARAAGLRVLMKPHLWFNRNGKWRSDIAMASDADWAAWFAAYRSYLAPFVEMAAELEVDAFCVGTELAGTIGREKEWRELVAWVRERYDGPLTYAAHWYKAPEIRFWDALDLVGVQAWFPLVEGPGASTGALVDAWAPWLGKMAELARRTGRPIVFTEFGYRARADAAVKPSSWDTSGPVDTGAQARAFGAAFRALERAPWLHGIFLWKWPAGYAGQTAGASAPRRDRHDGGFSPQGYPAEEVIFEAYRARAGDRGGR